MNSLLEIQRDKIKAKILLILTNAKPNKFFSSWDLVMSSSVSSSTLAWVNISLSKEI